MEKLESGFLRRATRLVDATHQAWQPESLRSYHRSERGIPADRTPKLMDRRPGHEGSNRVREKLEKVSANRARHAGSIHTTEMKLPPDIQFHEDIRLLVYRPVGL